VNIILKEIAQLIGGKITGNEDLIITRLSKIEEAQKGDLTFLYLPKYEKYFSSTKASAIIIKPDFTKSRNNITYLEVDEPDKAFAKIVVKYFSSNLLLTGIDKSASVDQSTEVGKNVALGKNVVIAGGGKIGSNVKIYHNVVLLENVEIGNNTVIFPNVTIRENCKIGKSVIIHAGSVIGSDGFGFNPDDKGVYHKVPQMGNVILEDDVDIGANVTIDRAALGSTIIKRGAKIDNLVQLGHNVVIGEDSVIAAQTGISGSTKIGNHCILAGQVGVAGHVEIGDNIVLLAQSGVSKSLKKPGLYFGCPAKELKTSHRLEAHIRNLPDYAERIRNLENEINVLKNQLENES